MATIEDMEGLIRESPAGTMVLARYPDGVRILVKDDNWGAQGDYLFAEVRAGLTVARGVAIIPIMVRVWGATVCYYGNLVDPHSELGQVLTALGRQDQCVVCCWGAESQPEHQVCVSVEADIALTVEAAATFDLPTSDAWWEGVQVWRDQYGSFEEVWEALSESRE